MSWLVLALLLHATAPAVVQPGETLAAAAQRLLGDPAAQTELHALNPGVPDAPKPGTHLKLPGPDRALALSALSAAQHAVDQSAPGADRDHAASQLAHARALFSQARYAEAANAADSAWKLLNKSADASTHFAIDVEKDGTTHVQSRSGEAIRVESEGKMVAVSPGQVVNVRKGEAPEFAPPPPQLVESLPTPRPLSPDDAHKLTFKTAGLLGPVTLKWTPVRGARSYEVSVVPLSGAGHKKVITAHRASATLRAMAPGRYRWTVKALGATGDSPVSEARTFELAREELILKVHATQWK